VSIVLQEVNYRLNVDVIPSQQGNAGLIVLFDGSAAFYQIGLRSNGSYAVQRLDGDTITNVTEWTDSPALKRGAGVANQMRIYRQGAIITFYANEQFLTDFPVPDESFTNRFGFTLTSATEQGQVSFDNLTGESLPDS